MESINNFWAAIGGVIEWGNSEHPVIVAMTIVGFMVTSIAVYMMMSYLIPAIVSVVVKKIRRSKFVRRLDRFFYLLRKEYDKKHETRRSDEPRVISTLTGNLNGSR